MKLLFILYFFISASLLVETEAGWGAFGRFFKKIGHKIDKGIGKLLMPKPDREYHEPKARPPVHYVKAHTIAGYVRHKEHGFYLTLKPQTNGFIFQSKKSRYAYFVRYTESNRMNLPDYKKCLYKRGKYANAYACATPWRTDAYPNQKIDWIFNSKGNFQIKHKDSGMCASRDTYYPLRNAEGTPIVWSKYCGPRSYIFTLEERLEKTNNIPDGRKRRDNSYRHSKRRASSHNRFRQRHSR